MGKATHFFVLWMLAVGMLLAGCNNDTTAPEQPPVDADISNRIYLVTGQSGQAYADAGTGALRITLDTVAPDSHWYSDRPERLLGMSTTEAFISDDWARVYGDVAPNALLQYRSEDGIHGLFGAVDDLAYDPVTQQITLTLNLAKATYDIRDGIGHFLTPVLTLLNNVAPEKPESSFALASTDAVVESDGTGGYQLVLDGVDSSVLWMNNAPQRQGDFETLPLFVESWLARFSDSAPNASLAGDIVGGGYGIVPLTLLPPVLDAATRRLTFPAIPLNPDDMPIAGPRLADAVLFVDAGPRSTPSTVFSQIWHGFAYSPVPSTYNSAPSEPSPFFDSDLAADNFQAIWGSKDGCGRNDLQVMANAGVNLIRLYDYNYLRGSSLVDVPGNGHIPFLDQALALGIRVIIPISNYNFRRDIAPRPWDSIGQTVAGIIESVKKDGQIHPAVHSFSIGNELDLAQAGSSSDINIPAAVTVATLINARAPDHFMTVPLSNANEMFYYERLRSLLPPDLYKNRFYNSVQTFKRDGNDLRDNILARYDAGNFGVPLMITEIGTNQFAVGSVDAKVDAIVGQASAVLDYLQQHPNSMVKGFAIFQWQNANWKRGGSSTDNSESTFGVHSYDGIQCESQSGEFVISGQDPQGNTWYHTFHPDQKYPVDRLKPLLSAQHPEGLLQALCTRFQAFSGHESACPAL